MREHTKRETPALTFAQETVRLPLGKDQKPSPVTTKTLPQAILTSDYQHLFGDLRKTLLLTGSVVIAELLIRFIMY